jgi:hypothetical protein
MKTLGEARRGKTNLAARNWSCFPPSNGPFPAAALDRCEGAGMARHRQDRRTHMQDATGSKQSCKASIAWRSAARPLERTCPKGTGRTQPW